MVRLPTKGTAGAAQNHPSSAVVLVLVAMSGGLQFAAGGKKLRVQDFVFDTRKGVLTARVSGTKTRVPLLKLNLSDADIDRSSGKVVVADVRATLTADAAAALNKTFGGSLFKRGLKIGFAKVTARFRASGRATGGRRGAAAHRSSGGSPSGAAGWDPEDARRDQERE
jgi:hypothetical protein